MSYRRPRARCISYLILSFVLIFVFYIGSTRFWISDISRDVVPRYVVSRDVVPRATGKDEPKQYSARLESEYRTVYQNVGADDYNGGVEQNSYVESNDSNISEPVKKDAQQEPGRVYLIHSYIDKGKGGGKLDMRFSKCKYKACDTTPDPEKADLLMFDGERMRDAVLPPRRPQGQIWLVYSREPPLQGYFLHMNRSDMLDQFNWTRFIHIDSTFWARHGHLYERPLPNKDYESIYRNKTYDVAWFVSNCEANSRREEYIKRMTSEIDVHVYGRCGTMECGAKGYGMGGEKEGCLHLLSQKYKFYLSFESTMCQGYVSEKFFNMFEDVDVIPVVRGGADYHKRFPPDTCIISSDFPSPESLGKYLYSLARDEKRYIEILKNKSRYVKGPLPSDFRCDLCKALHLQQPVSVYHNVAEWLRRPDKCWPPTDI